MDMAEVNRQVIEAFRAGIDPPGMHRDRLLLLTTRGARTGKPHIAPMMFHRNGELADQAYPALAVPLEGAERDHIWAEIKRLYPFFVDHEAKVDREIPVVELRGP